MPRNSGVTGGNVHPTKDPQEWLKQREKEINKVYKQSVKNRPVIGNPKPFKMPPLKTSNSHRTK